jgi:succinate-semialdehyde dehydrogenase/glutarate-semialdehyde dehydrogenase
LIATVNPYNNKVVREFPSMSVEAIDHAVETADWAFGSWRRTPVDMRAAFLQRAALLVRERGETLAGCFAHG